MGVVYLAHDRLVNRKVAYKRLWVQEETMRARSLALFEREYNALAQLAHPAIVEVYDYGSDERDAYYTMELLSGRDLVALAPLPVGEVCRVLRDVASALALLHARRVIHRDLSPANVRLTEDGRAKLIDFGALTPFGVAPDLVGTPAFVAPECLAGAALDQRTDLYALGALAYWALTGRVAVRARTLEELRFAWSLPIEPPSSYAAELPKPLENLVMSLLSREPLARPASAAEVMDRLSAIGNLSAEPDEAKVAYSYLAHPPLVGRGEVLEELSAALGRVAQRRGASLMIEAEPGSGKSALLDQVALRGQLRGVTVLRGRGNADAGAFALARALMRGCQAAHPELEAFGQVRDTQLTLLLGGKRARPEAWSAVQVSERQARTIASMQEALLQASARNPIVVMVDDLHAADAESLALLASLSEVAREHPLLLVLAGAERTAGSDAYRKLVASCSRMALRALRADDVEELVEAVFGRVPNSHRLATFLHERSDGNPAHCMDLARLLLQRGLIRYAGGTFTLPHDVSAELRSSAGEEAQLTRLAGVSRLAREVAELVSLQPVPFEVAQIACALGASAREVMLACEELSGRDLVSASERQVAMTSAALREAIASSLDADARRRLHARAAGALLETAEASDAQHLQTCIHLLKAGEDVRAAELLLERNNREWLLGETPVALLESVLEVLRKQGRADEHCLAVLVPLVRGGFFGDMNAQRRHLDPCLRALANVCGVTTAARLTPRFGAKLALIFGVLGALLRHAFTSKKLRFGSFTETMGALLSTISASTAGASSSMEAKEAFRIVAMFEPLRAFGPDSAPYLSIEFGLATAELGAGRYALARARYERLLARFERPVKGMSDEIHLQFRQGILHGLAQTEAVNTNRSALKLADELEAGHMFFAPHAETVRMGYRGYRGEQEQCDTHRKRGELLALRGGISWSAVTMMTIRSSVIAMQTGDAVALLQLLPELERLREVAPNALLFQEATLAYLELVRDRPARAASLYEQLFASPHAAYMITHALNRVYYARALSALGRLEEAKRVCLEVHQQFSPDEVRLLVRAPLQQLALIALQEGDFEGARARLQQLLTELSHYDNPLWTGSAHRDLARVALAARDMQAFQTHARAMSSCFRATQNPLLIQQCELLQAEADAQLKPVRALAPARAFSDNELDELSTAIETDQQRIAAMSGDYVPIDTQSRMARRGSMGSE